MTSSPEPQSALLPLPWSSLTAPGSEALGDARREAVNLAQWLARIANSYVAADAQEERLTLEFRAADAAFVTRAFEKNLALEMRLPKLEMQFLEDGKPAPHILDPEEHSPAEVEAWLLVELFHRGLDTAKFSKSLPYTVPGLMSGDAEDHSPQSCLQPLSVLEAWYRNAAAVLHAASGAADARIVCWPQDLSLKCVMDAKVAGFGFSPGDAEHPEPFFYVNSVAGTDAGAAVMKRAMLSASALLAERDPSAALKAFLKASG